MFVKSLKKLLIVLLADKTFPNLYWEKFEFRASSFFRGK